MSDTIKSDAFKHAGDAFKNELREMLLWSIRYDCEQKLITRDRRTEG